MAIKEKKRIVSRLHFHIGFGSSTVKISRIFRLTTSYRGMRTRCAANKIRFPVMGIGRYFFLPSINLATLPRLSSPLFFHEVSRPATWETTDLACDSHCHGAPPRYESSCNSALNDLQKTCLLASQLHTTSCASFCLQLS